MLRLQEGGEEVRLLGGNGEGGADVVPTVGIVAALVEAAAMQIHQEVDVVALVRSVLVHAPPIPADVQAHLPVARFRLPGSPVAQEPALDVADELPSGQHVLHERREREGIGSHRRAPLVYSSLSKPPTTRSVRLRVGFLLHLLPIE